MRLIKQNTYKDCGIACIAMLINHFFNFNIDINQIKYQLNIEDNQLSFFELIEIAEKFNLRGDAFEVNKDFDELKSKTPFLAQIVNSDNVLHFVVIEKIFEKSILYLDPSCNKKQREQIYIFLKKFQKNIIIFKANKIEFKKNFKLDFKDFLKLLNFNVLNSIWISVALGLIMIFEAKIIKTYSETFFLQQQKIYFYLLFFLIFVLNSILKKISSLFLNNSYQNKLFKDLKLLINYASEENKVDLYEFYTQIVWINKFEHFQLINFIATFLIEIIALVYIFFISKIIFLVMLLTTSIIMSLIYFWFQIFNKKNIIDETNKNWFGFLTNNTYFKNTGKENKKATELLKKRQINESENFLGFIELIEKIMSLLIFYFSWNFIKIGELNFETFFMILLLKSFNKSLIFSFYNLCKNWKRYLSFKIKFKKIIFKDFNLIDVKNIENISIKKQNYKIDIAKGKTNFLNEICSLKCINKTFKKNDIEILINKKNITLLSGKSIRENIFYVNGNDIIYATIFQNIINDEKNSLDFFSNPAVINFFQKYKIKIDKLIDPQNTNIIEKEVISLFSIFFKKHQVILLDVDFKIIKKIDLKNILKIFNEMNSDKFLILP